MLTPPTTLEKGKPKEVKNKTYWFCPKHNFWTRHTPEEFKGINTNKDAPHKTSTPETANKSKTQGKARTPLIQSANSILQFGTDTYMEDEDAMHE